MDAPLLFPLPLHYPLRDRFCLSLRDCFTCTDLSMPICKDSEWPIGMGPESRERGHGFKFRPLLLGAPRMERSMALDFYSARGGSEFLSCYHPSGQLAIPFSGPWVQASMVKGLMKSFKFSTNLRKSGNWRIKTIRPNGQDTQTLLSRSPSLSVVSCILAAGL